MICKSRDHDITKKVKKEEDIYKSLKDNERKISLKNKKYIIKLI